MGVFNIISSLYKYDQQEIFNLHIILEETFYPIYILMDQVAKQ